MGRISHHLKGSDYKKTHQRCLDEQRALYLERREKVIEEQLYLEEIERLSQPYKSDWRSDINEGMTSSGVFFSTLPATGDADIASLDVDSSSSYTFSSDVSYDQGGLTFNPSGTLPYAITNIIDTSTSDSITFTGYANPNFSTQSDLLIYWYNHDTGQYAFLPSITRTTTSPTTYNANLPLAARGKNVDFTFYQSRSSSNIDFVGKPIYIGGQSVNVNPNYASGLASSIASVLANYETAGTPGRESKAFFGRMVTTYAAQNPSQFAEYASTQGNPYYPGITGPVSGNIGDPNITGFNGELDTIQGFLQTQSVAFISGYLSSYTRQNLIDMFGTDTTLNGGALYDELGEWNTLTDNKNSYYGLYVQYDIAGNTNLANYYLNLSNQASAAADVKESEISSRISSANHLPDSQWTDADWEKVADDVYNLYKNAFSYNITGFSTKRRTPVNVFVPLSSPEASSFIRTDPIMQGLSADERRKKLEDMLDSGDEYMLKQLGLQGSKARPADTGNAPGFMDIQVGDERITRTYDADGNYTGADTGWQPDPEQKTSKTSNIPTKTTNLNTKTNTPNTTTKTSANTIANTDKISDAELYKLGLSRGSDGKIYNLPTNTGRTEIDAMDPLNLATNAVLAKLGLGGLAAAQKYFNKGKNQRIPNEDAADLGTLFADDLAQRGQSDVAHAAGQKPSSIIGRPDRAVLGIDIPQSIQQGKLIRVPASKGGPGSAPTPLARQIGGRVQKPAMAASGETKRKTQKNSYEPQGQVLSEKKLKSPKEVMNKIPGYYDGKPAPLGFPDSPPPKMVNGFHPDLVDGKKVADRFNRLDPQSAQAMPPTGNPHIDKKVRAAAKKPK